MKTRSFAGCAALAGVVALAIVPGTASAQAVGAITGVVVDPTNRPLEGVQIFIPELNRGTLTQSNGRYFLINVPVGTYAVEARMLGYATLRHEGVVVATDISRQLNFTLVSEAIAVDELIVTADRVPIVELTSAGSQSTITSEELASLPVTTVAGALSLQQGFLEVPNNTEVLSLGEERRNVLSPIRIRGGRHGETLMVVDGIPVNNWVLGGPAIDITTKAVRQVDLLRGGLEPQYGNALSGVMNITTREGGTTPSGELEYRTSAFAGNLLNSTPDRLRDHVLIEGFLAGPVPFVPDNRLRYVIAGKQQNSAGEVLEFDDDIYVPSDPTRQTANALDVFPGWRAIGFDGERDFFGKLTYHISPTSKVNFSAYDYRRERQPFDFRYLLTYGDPLESPAVRTAEDSAAYIGNRIGLLGIPLRFQDAVVNTARLDRQLYVLSYNHTLSRGFFRGALGRFDQSRLTCNWWQGVCLEDRFQEKSFTGDRFVAAAPAGRLVEHPVAATDDVYGGEDLRSFVARGDVQWQATDHHNLQVGVFYQRHSIDFDETEQFNINNVAPIYNRFEVEPWDAAFYVQDRIEYDFIALSLGFRFDYGRAPGFFFRNPLDPTNGTHAGDVVCNPQDWQNVPVRIYNPETNRPEVVTMSADPAWTALCVDPETRTPNQVDDPEALRQAMMIASSDDMGTVSSRRQFSPRLRVSLPVTETASLFFNFGRYSQNPSIRNLYNYSGIGTPFEGIPLRIATDAGVQRADYFGPRTHDSRSSTTATFVGNSALLTEKTTAYEVGWLAEVSDNVGLAVTLFAKDQTGLVGYRFGGQLETGARVFDPGSTYGTAQPLFGTLVNGDFQTVRGFDVQLRRRLQDYWAFDMNYSFSQTRTNARALERAAEAFSRENESLVRVETVSEIDQPHVFNAALRFMVGSDAPDIPFGAALRHTAGAVTLRAASGLPYTPTLGSLGGTNATNAAIQRLDLNSGRGPATYRVDLQAAKNFSYNGIAYGAFVTVTNVFDRKNCIQVYATTGDCKSGAIDQSRAAQGFSNTQADLTLLTTTVFDHPEYFRDRRTINAGVKVSF